MISECDKCQHSEILFESNGCGDWRHERYCELRKKLVNKHDTCSNFKSRRPIQQWGSS